MSGSHPKRFSACDYRFCGGSKRFVPWDDQTMQEGCPDLERVDFLVDGLVTESSQVDLNSKVPAVLS